MCYDKTKSFVDKMRGLKLDLTIQGGSKRLVHAIFRTTFLKIFFCSDNSNRMTLLETLYTKKNTNDNHLTV